MKKKELKISYTYDPLNRLSTAAVNGETTKHYGYDGAGNLVSISPHKREIPAAVTGPGTSSGLVAAGERVEQQESAPHKEPPAMDKRFGDLEEQYHRYNSEVQAGAISLEQFAEKVNELRFQDAGGTWWQLRFDGIWLKWDGTAWVEAQ